MEHADLLIGDQHGAILVDGLHLFGVGDHVGSHIATIELHAFHNFGVGLGSGLVLLNGDNAIRSNFLHCIGNQLANLGIPCRNSANAGNVLAAVDLLAVGLHSIHSSGNGLLHTALNVHGIRTRGHVLHAFVDQSLCQNGSRSGTVTSGIVGLGCHFADQLSTHVLKLILQLDLFCDGHAVIGDQRAAKLLGQNHIAAFGAKGNLYSIGQLVDTGAQRLAGFSALLNLFSHRALSPLYQNVMI